MTAVLTLSHCYRRLERRCTQCQRWCTRAVTEPHGSDSRCFPTPSTSRNHQQKPLSLVSQQAHKPTELSTRHIMQYDITLIRLKMLPYTLHLKKIKKNQQKPLSPVSQQATKLTELSREHLLEFHITLSRPSEEVRHNYDVQDAYTHTHAHTHARVHTLTHTHIRTHTGMHTNSTINILQHFIQ